MKSQRPGPFATSLILCLLMSVFLWFADMLFAEPSGITGAFSSLFLLTACLVPLSIPLGLFLWTFVGNQDPFALSWGRIRKCWHFLWTSNPETGLFFMFRVTGLCMYLLMAILLSVVLSITIATVVVQPSFTGMLSVAGTLGVFAALYPVYLLIREIGTRLPSGVPRTRGLRLLWQRPGVVLCLAVAAGLAAAALFAVEYWAAIERSPWQLPATLGAAALASIVATPWVRRLFSVSRTGLAITFSMLMLPVLASSVAAVGLDPNNQEARRFFLRCPGTSLAFGLALDVLDSDEDGYMAQFAGGDCEPDDPEVSPGAVDIPGNGIDENCDGKDLELNVQIRGKYRHRLPKEFSAKGKPVILVSGDALSALHLGYMGYQRDTSPNLDRLASECVVFDKAFSEGPSTRLALGAMFTSRYDSQLLLKEVPKVPFPMEGANVTLAELFAKNGYDTAAVVPNKYFTKSWKSILQGFSTIDASAFAVKSVGKHTGQRVTDQAIEILKKKRSKPLFMWVHYYDVHPPFSAVDADVVFGKKERTDLYDTELRYMVVHMGRLFDALDNQYGKGGYLLVVTADHGSAIDERHKKDTHAFDIYSSVLHIPLMFCNLPGIPARRVSQTPVSALDLMPTLVNLLQLKPGKDFMEGTSLVPLITSEKEWPDRLIFHQFYLAERIRDGKDPLSAASVRSGRYHFIWNRKKSTFELYDYDAEPGELTNLADDYPDVAAELMDSLESIIYLVANPE